MLTVAGDVTTESNASLHGVEEMILTGGTRFPHFGGADSPAQVTLNADLALDHTSAVTGHLVVNKKLTLAGQNMAVNRNLTVQTSTGLVDMTGGGYFSVDGNATFAGGSLATLLTNGTFDLRGNFSQSNAVSSNSFKATGSHLTILSGTGAQTVNFLSTAGSSQFNDLSVENTSASGVTMTSIGNAGRDLFVGVTGGPTTKLTMGDVFNVGRNLDAKAGANLIHSGTSRHINVTGAVTAGSTADLGGLDTLRLLGTSQPFPIYNNTTAGKAPRVTLVSGSTILGANATVAGAVSIGSGSSIDINGKSLTIKDSLIQGGTLTMSTGSLTIGGKLREDPTATAFTPASTFLVTLNGSSTQSVAFSNGSSRFTNLDITNTQGVSLDTRVDVFGILAVRTGAKLTVSAAKTLAFDNAAFLRLHSSSTFTINGVVSTNAWSCQRHNAPPLPTIDGTNTGSSDGTGFVVPKCNAGVTSLP